MRQRKAFSLVELLTVIGVIAILVAMVVVGFKYVGAGGKAQASRAMLETARALMTEYTVNANTSGLPSGVVDASLNPTDPNSADRYTEAAMIRLLANPKVRGDMDRLPTDRVRASNVNGTATRILLDAWNNPIYYVPGVLYNVRDKGGNDVYIVTAAGKSLQNKVPVAWTAPSSYSPGDLVTYGTGLYLCATAHTSDAATPPPNANWTTISGKPFWVSAGPNGDLANVQEKQDDNLYSFGN